MRHARAYGLAGLAALAVAAAAVAQTTVTPVPDQAPVQVDSRELGFGIFFGTGA